ncbi:MAG TPA: hypothetical protein VGF06_06525 [Terriglobales bacterium]|jgi:hypothetical protein
MDARTYCALVGGDDSVIVDAKKRPHMGPRHQNRLAYMPAREQDLNSQSTKQLAEALHNLYDLLEEYAPAWYTQEHREKAEAALRMLKGS